MKTILTLILLTALTVSIPLKIVAQTNEPPPQQDAGGGPPDNGGGPPSDGPMGPPPDMAAPGLLPAVLEAVAAAAATNNNDSAPRPAAETSAPGRAGAFLPAAGNAGEPLPPVAAGTNGSSGLRLNFRGVPLELVLNYLSDAAGFIVVLETPVRGNVDVISSQPLSKDEAVDLLNTVLNKNGYAAIRNGRMLTIVNKDEAKTKDVPVVLGSDPDKIPKTDMIVTQIIPVRFVEAAQLIKDLQPLVPLQSTITANEAGNAIVITDTQANIHRVAEIIKAIDTGAEAVTEVRVFHLSYADPVEMATLLGSVFPDDSKSGANTSPIRFGGGRGGGGFAAMFGGGGNTGGSSGGNNDRIKKNQRVTAVADQRTASVVVSAPGDLMEQISGMITQLDSNPAKKQKVFVYHLDNADSEDVLPVLQDMFQKNSTSRSTRSTTQSALQTRSSSSQSTSSSGSSSMGGTSGGGRTRGGGIGGGN